SSDLRRDCTPGSDARASDDDTVHAPWRHGEHVNKVSVGEPADGSPPKERHKQFGGLGKVERASASRSRTSNPLLFGLQISLSVRPSRRWVHYQGSSKDTNCIPHTTFS